MAGGSKGFFPRRSWPHWRQACRIPSADYFDLIVGTSTGGIIAIGLGLGLSATDVLRFYEDHGPAIFGGNRFVRGLRHWGRSKYDQEPLRTALGKAFGDRKLGESLKRLVIPSLNLDTGEVHIWKTAHHPRLQIDYKKKAVEAALATAAAPSYFPTFRSESGSPLVDGGMWANNPCAVGVVEAIGILGWDRADVHVLSLGCTTSVMSIKADDWWPKGKLAWAKHVADVFMAGQSSSALGMSEHLLGNKDQIIRISPSVASTRYDLDRISEIPSLRGLGESEARKALPVLLPVFFKDTVDPFQPCHSV
jgi:uncharacterized protein